MTNDPTGIQIRLRAIHDDREITAHITQVGATLRGLTIDGTDFVVPYPEGIPAPNASGTVLVPWPNRVRDGQWTYKGASYQLAITEPVYNNASHGLLRFMPYEVATTDTTATLSAHVFPQTGYPFHLATQVTYALTPNGIEVTHEITNVGASTAPVALGTHPFVCIGDVPTSDLTLTSTGSSTFPVDDRMLPSAPVPVPEALDLRGGRPLAELTLDTAYGGLTRDSDGISRHTVTATDGRTVTLWQGEGFDYVQFFTSRSYPGRKVALAIEPMTAPADAFNSGIGLHELAPGEPWTLRWGIEAAGLGS